MSEITILKPASDDVRWYALTVRHQHERQTEKALRSKGLETLVPLYRSRRQWSDRVQELELPLFAGYVMSRFALSERIGVLSTPGVASIVGFGGKPAPLEDAEIAAIERLLASKLALAPWPYLKPGDRVRVEHGPQVEAEAALYTREERRLFEVRPGITDLASIVFSDEGEILAGSADPDLKYGRVIRPLKSRLGLLYVERRSFAADFKILGLTLVAAISREKALAGIERLLAGWNADPLLLRMARRREPLLAWPPPGSAAVSGGELSGC